MELNGGMKVVEINGHIVRFNKISAYEVMDIEDASMDMEKKGMNYLTYIKEILKTAITGQTIDQLLAEKEALNIKLKDERVMKIEFSKEQALELITYSMEVDENGKPKLSRRKTIEAILEVYAEKGDDNILNYLKNGYEAEADDLMAIFMGFQEHYDEYGKMIGDLIQTFQDAQRA